MKRRGFLQSISTLAGIAFVSGRRARADDTPDARRERFEMALRGDADSIDQVLEKYRTPALSIAVVANGAIDWSAAYGVASADTKNAISDKMMFQAASVSKPVAAVAAMRLVQEGRIGLDEDVNEKLTSWKIPDRPGRDNIPITLRMLLSHTAGLTVHGFPGYEAGTTVPTLIQVLNGERPANTAAIRRDLPPGKQWRYSGGGYCIVQQLIEDITKKKFEIALSELVLMPYGMTSSTFAQPLPDDLADRAACAHNGRGVPLKKRWHVYPEQAAAGLWTTPSDLCRFGIGLARDAIGPRSKVLESRWALEMLKVQKNNFGLGLALVKGTKPAFAHNGANAGFRSGMMIREDLSEGVVLMTNSDNGGELQEEAMRVLGREKG